MEFLRFGQLNGTSRGQPVGVTGSEHQVSVVERPVDGCGGVAPAFLHGPDQLFGNVIHFPRTNPPADDEAVS